MNTLTIKQAAELAGVSRSTLYRSYINNGKLSVSEDSYGKPAIDLSELLRVFPHIRHDDTRHEDTDRNTELQNRTTAKNDLLSLELKNTKEILRLREEQLREAAAREEKLLELLGSLQRQLTNETIAKNNVSPWWRFWER